MSIGALAFEKPEKTRTAVRHQLQHCPLFEGADKEAVADLAELCDVRRAEEGEIVIREGDEGDAMYVILRGRVRVEKHTPYHDTYTVTFLDEERGGFFGELALLDRDLRSASVVAETSCEFLVIRREDFLAFGDCHTAAGLTVTRRIARILAERLRRANRDAVTLFAALVQEIGERL